MHEGAFFGGEAVEVIDEVIYFAVCGGDVALDHFALAVTDIALGRRGGKKGGRRRAEKMTPEQRSEAARKAARARWGKSRSE